jgi:hypothetical protein
MRRLLPLPLLAAAALVLPACGGSGSSSGSTDPAEAAPASSLVYANVVVRPSGDLKSSVDAAASKILDGADAGQKIQQGIDQALSGANLNYNDDVKPWLGERAGFFLTSVTGSSASGAVIVDSKDDDKATSTIEKGLKDAGASLDKSSYKGADIETVGGQGAFSVHDGLVIAGTEDGVKAALAARDGDHLSDASAYKDATDKVSKDGIALFYVDTPRLLDAAGQSDPQTAALIQTLKANPQVAKLGPAAAAVTVTSDSIAFEAPASKEVDTPHPVADLPADSWIALSVGSLGDNLRTSLKQLSASGNGQALALIEDQIRNQTGLSLQSDLLGWLTDATGFIAGSPSSFAAGALLGSNDPAASKRAVAKIGRTLKTRSGLPITPKGNGFSVRTSQGDIAVLAQGDQVLGALGKDALAQTKNPSSKLSDDSTFQSALKAMGDNAKPALYLSVPTALQYAAAGGSASDIQSAEPYIRHFAYLVYGTAQGSGGTLGRLVIGLK